MPLPVNFDGKYRTGPSGCMTWTGALLWNGYGSVWDLSAGRSALAHRLAWESQRGVIPDGLTIDHLCRNKACVNVEHMEIVTYAENTRRRTLAPVTHCPQGHEYTPENTYYSTGGRGKMPCKSCRTCRRERNRARRAAQREAAMSEAPATLGGDRLH